MIVYLFPLILVGGAVLALGALSHTRSASEMRNIYLVWTIVVAIIAFTEALIHMTDDLGTMYVLNDIQYTANVAIGPVLLIGSMYYVGKSYLLRRRNIALLFVVPAITLTAVLTNDVHHLYYISTAVRAEDSLFMFETGWGPLWFLHIGYNLVLISCSVAIMFLHWRRSEGFLRKDARRLTEAMSFPILFNFFLLSGSSVAAVYCATFGYALSAAWIFWVIFRYEVLDITPIAHEVLMGNMTDPAIIVDISQNVIGMNASASRMAMSAEFRGAPLRNVLPFIPSDALGEMKEGGSGTFEVSIQGDSNLEFELQVTRMVDHRSDLIGHLVILRDVTERNRITRELEAANARLNLLNSTNRHDIQNQVTAAWGFSSLLRSMDLPPKAMGHVSRIDGSMRAINDMINFTKDYQDLGTRAPDWVSLGEALGKAGERVHLEGIELRGEVDDLHVFADPLFERVLLNLMENSIRHGGEVTRLSLRPEFESGSMRLIYEDDGKGIVPEDKHRIFDPGFGRNTGMGLYACKQILNLTDIGIVENGEEGARFEMTFRPGTWERT